MLNIYFQGPCPHCQPMTDWCNNCKKCIKKKERVLAGAANTGQSSSTADEGRSAG